MNDLVHLARVTRMASRRNLSETPQARWNRDNQDRLTKYKRAWRSARRAMGLLPT